MTKLIKKTNRFTKLVFDIVVLMPLAYLISTVPSFFVSKNTPTGSLLTPRAHADFPYSQSTYYSQNGYYTEGTYYSQGTYSPSYGQSTYYSQNVYYGQSGYYSQSTYYGQSTYSYAQSTYNEYSQGLYTGDSSASDAACDGTADGGTDCCSTL